MPLQVNGTIVPLKLDTGAKANLISTSDIKEMKMEMMLFVVVPNDHHSLLGNKACEELGLVKRVFCINSHDVTATKQDTGNDIVRRFDDVSKDWELYHSFIKFSSKKMLTL